MCLHPHHHLRHHLLYEIRIYVLPKALLLVGSWVWRHPWQPMSKSLKVLPETVGECTNMFGRGRRGRDGEVDCLLQSHIPRGLHWEMAGEPSDWPLCRYSEKWRGGDGDSGLRRWNRSIENSALPTNYYPRVFLPTNFYPRILLHTTFYTRISITYQLLS